MYEDNKYNYSFYSPQGGQQPPPEPPKKKKIGLKILALGLACMLIGGAMGGTAGWLVSSNYRQADGSANTQDVQQMSTEIMPAVTSTLTANRDASLESIYEKCNPSVVAIATEGVNTNAFGQSATFASAGSGFIISSDGYIVTNAHVISASSKVMVMLYDGTTHDAKVIGEDSVGDVAVLKIDKTDLTAATFGDSEGLKVGQQVVAIGNPLGELANSMTTGIISALDRAINIDGTPMNMLQTDTSVSPGNSGGPLIDMSGNVIGIVSAKSSGSGVEGIGFAIPINDAREIVSQLIENGYVAGRALLGVGINESYSAAAAYYNMPLGCYVASVTAGSAADKAGVAVGDVITQLGDTKVTRYEELSAALLTFKAGDTTTIVINRSGTEKTLTVTFDEKVPTSASSSNGRSEQETQPPAQSQQSE